MATSSLLYLLLLFGGWGNGHIHYHHPPLRGWAMATSVPTILLQGNTKCPEGKYFRESPYGKVLKEEPQGNVQMESPSKKILIRIP